MDAADACVVSSRDGRGGLVVRIGIPLVDVYLEFLGGRCRPIWATAAVKLGGRPFGELRPALAWRDDLRENGGALDGPAKGRTSRSAAASVGR